MPIQTTKISQNDTIFITFPMNQYDVEMASDIIKVVKEAFPNNIVLGIPSNIDFIIARKDNAFL